MKTLINILRYIITGKQSIAHCKLLTAICLLLYCSLLTAQVYPVQVNTQLIPPHSLKLSDYVTTQSEKLIANVLMTDVNEYNRQLRFRLTIKGNGLTIRSNDVVMGANPVFADGGVPLRLTNIDLRPYFELQNLQGITPQQYNNPLPDGNYQFCLEVFDWVSGQRLSNPQLGCANVYLIINDPPFLNLPRKSDMVAAKNPQNIVFNWTPRHLNATNVQYEFELREIWDTQIDPQAAFLASSNLYQTTTRNNTLLYGPGETTLLENKTYAWRVRAVINDGISETSVFRNNGYSEIFYFTYTADCSAPEFILAKSLSSDSEEITWQPNIVHQGYNVQYRKKGVRDAVWFEANAVNPYTKLYNLESGTAYEFRVGGECMLPIANQESRYSYSQIQEFTTPIKAEDSYYNCGIVPKIKITNKEPLPNLVVNDMFTAGDFPVTVKQVNPSPSGGGWEGAGYIVVPYLANTKIAVEFDNVRINTDYQLYEGTLYTTYDPDWSNMDDVSDELDVIVEIPETIERKKDILEDVFGETPDEIIENEETGDVIVDNSGDGTDTENDGNNSNDPSADDNPEADGTEVVDTGGGNNTTSPPDQLGGGTVPPEEENDVNSEQVVIVYDGKAYNDGETIEIPFGNVQSQHAFLLKNYPEEAKLEWKVLHEDADHTDKYALNETTQDNFKIDMGDVYMLDLVSNYNDERIKVTIKRVSVEFDLVELYAKPSKNNNRLAKSGEILYLVDSEHLIDSTSKRKVDYGLKISPNLSEKQIAEQNIVWHHVQSDTRHGLEKEYGKKVIHRELDEEGQKYTTTVSAGNPDMLNKSVDVVWVDRDYGKFKYSIASDDNPFLKKAFEATKTIGKFSKFADKIPFLKRVRDSGMFANSKGEIAWFFELIPFEQTKENIEAPNNRLYYTEKKTGGGFEAGLKGKANIWTWGLPFDKLPLPDKAIKEIKDIVTFEVNIVASANAKGAFIVELKERKWAESNDWETVNKGVNPASLSLNAQFGAEAEISALKNNDWFSIGGKASGVAKAELLSIGWFGNDFKYTMLREGIWLDLTANAYIAFMGKKLETTPYYQKVEIIPPQK